MCGIAGFFNHARLALPDPEAAVGRMTDVLAHRGPDDAGTWRSPDGRVWLGHRRLSILDLSAAGHQPMGAAGRPTVAFNGEIYNFAELRAQFPDRRFASQTDTEVLLALYERDGEAMLDQLNGMFAFAIWDPQRERLFLARDRVGIKPLYVTRQGGVFAFASEVRALLQLPWVRPTLDEEALYHFLTYNKVMPPRTMFRDIYKLQPGHRLTVDRDGNARDEQWWEVEYQDLGDDSESIQARLADALQTSVQRRMIADVPVGAFLSGGVDSSAVVALMRELTDHPVSTYSIGFQDAPHYDELDHARRTAERLGTDHHERIVTPDDMREALPQMVEVFDEPLADATSVPIHFLSEQARANGTIAVLTGDGADELFSGYRNWQRYLRYYPYYRAFTALPRPVKRLVAHAYGAVDAGSPNVEVLQRATDDEEFFWGGAKGFKEHSKSDLLSPAYAERMAAVDSHEPIAAFRRDFEALDLGRRAGDVDWMCYLGVKSIVPDLYLHRADRLGMASSIELRVPFLDHEVVGLALSTPGALKTAGGEPKAILKRALEGVLPHDTLYRKKQGFCVPLREWAGDLMVDYLDRNLGRFCQRTGLFNEAGLRAYLQRAERGDGRSATALWNLYFLMSWFDRWLP